MKIKTKMQIKRCKMLTRRKIRKTKTTRANAKKSHLTSRCESKRRSIKKWENSITFEKKIESNDKFDLITHISDKCSNFAKCEYYYIHFKTKIEQKSNIFNNIINTNSISKYHKKCKNAEKQELCKNCKIRRMIK